MRDIAIQGEGKNATARLGNYIFSAGKSANKAVMEFTIVSESEADFSQGKLAATTPIGRALMGHAKGETVEAKVPNGVMKFKILDISI